MSYARLPGPFDEETRERWRVEGPIPGGTVATLWRVRSADGTVAACAKVVPAEVGQVGPARRFLVERGAFARLPRRSALPQLLESSVAAEGTGLLVMTLFEGTTLRRRLASPGPPRPAIAVGWARQLLEVLAAVHDVGLVHCDVKPENVLVDGEGADARLALVDFGLATSTGEPCVAEGGAAAGTPSYMAPEQVRGEAVDARTDLYAVAIVLYELLTGAPPFTGSPSVDVRTQQLQARPVPPSVVAFDADVPEALSQAVLKGLEKKPDSRFRSAPEMAAALAAAVA